jgi:F0F1-type ATP synthase membrane subunit a
MNLKKMQNVSDKYVTKFNKAATELVMEEVTGTTDENKKTIALITARDMAIGAVIKRSEHILTGLAIGVLGTALTIGIVNKIKKNKKNKKKEVQVPLEIIEEFINKTIPDDLKIKKVTNINSRRT